MNFVLTSEVVFNKFRCFWCVRQSRVIRSLASGTLRSVIIVVVVVVVLIRVLLFLFLTTPHRCRVTLRCEQLCEAFCSVLCVCSKTNKKVCLILNFLRQPARQTNKVFKNSARSAERFDKDGDSGVLFERRGAFSSSS